MTFQHLSSAQKDVLRELSNIGMGHAATALSRMIGRPLMVEVPAVRVVDLAEVPNLVGGPEHEVAGVVLRLEGDASGHMLLVLAEPDAAVLAGLLLGQTAGTLDGDLERSALQELANVIGSCYLSVLGDMLNLRLRPSIPFLAVDMAGAVVDQVLGELGCHGDLALLLETRFTCAGADNVRGHLFLLPDPPTLEVLLQAAGGVG
ncbi:MAG: chemotaxis protein CheC [Deltaproteobacteria bacterium]|nr:MAG: chemotaxis protein CheC [Deltaproteobacteria bacterium]